jgi:hypothetical protein
MILRNLVWLGVFVLCYDGFVMVDRRYRFIFIGIFNVNLGRKLVDLVGLI